MLTSWWDLGENYGYDGKEIALYQIECPFCEERGNFIIEHHPEKNNPNSNKKLNFDTLRCNNYAGYVLVFWSAASHIGIMAIHDFRIIPWPLKINFAPDYLPEEIKRYWIQAMRNLKDENLEAAVIMARSALQIALRDNKATGRTLKDEIKDLAEKGILPPIMKDWSDNIRELGNEVAHPRSNKSPTQKVDARDIIDILRGLISPIKEIFKLMSR